jgi:hypothetical protein
MNLEKRTADVQRKDVCATARQELGEQRKPRWRSGSAITKVTLE